MDEENKPGAIEKTTEAIKKAKQMKKTIDLIKKSKVLGPIIGAILPVIGWILLVFVIILAVVASIILAIAFAKPIINAGDNRLNWLSGYGYLPSDAVYYNELNKAYEDFYYFNNPEGEFDIATIQATTFFNRMVDPNLKIDENKMPKNLDEDVEELSDSIDESGIFQPIIDEINYVDFYRIAAYNVGNVHSGTKLAGHLVDIKLTAGNVCYNIPEGILETGGEIIEQIFSTITGDSEISDLAKDLAESINLYIDAKIKDENLIKVGGVLIARFSQGFWQDGLKDVSLGEFFSNLGDGVSDAKKWFDELFDELRLAAGDENVFNDIKRIVLNSNFSNSKCDKSEYFIPRITHYVNYDRYENYLREVYLPNQPYAYCEKCKYKNASKEEKSLILDNWIQDIMNLRDLYVSSFPSLTEKKNMLSFTCPNGVTVKDKEGNDIISNLDLEEYVKGVVAAENSEAPFESMKAQAVASRTYVLHTTNFCESSIISSSSAQNYKEAPEGGYSATIDEAVTATRGEVLQNTNGKIFKTEYDAFCALEDCNNLENCIAQYQKIPSSGFHTFSIPATYIKKSNYKNACNDKIKDDGGHGRGMSQIYANYMANNLTTSSGEKYNYRDILSFFYGDGVTIGNVGLFYAELGNIEETPKTIYFHNTINDVNRCGSDKHNFFQDNKSSLDYELKSYVGSDFGTRKGPVKAAYFLSGEMIRSSIVVPYFFGGGHGSFPIEGINKNWGSTCSTMWGDTTKQPKGNMFNLGLDCSSFVSWALYNGGFNQNTVTANTLAYLGSGPNVWNEASKSAQAGDLAVNWYKQDKKYGHVGIIIKVDESNIWIAHEAGASRGLIIEKYSKGEKTGFSHIVLMDSYYNDSNKRR